VLTEHADQERVASADDELSRTVLVRACAALAAVFAALAPVQLLTTSGAARVVMPLVSLATAVVLAGVARRGARERDAELPAPVLVATVLGLPALTLLVHLAVARDLSQTGFLVLVVVAAGALVSSVQMVAALVVGSVLGWVLVVEAISEPVGAVAPQAVLLVTAVVLAGLLHASRTSFARRVALERSRQVSQFGLAGDAVTGALTEGRRFQALFDESPVGIGVFDARGGFVHVNASLASFLGRTPDDLLGRTTTELTHPDDVRDQLSAREQVAASFDGVAHLEKRYLLPDGAARWASVTATAMAGPRVRRGPWRTCWTCTTGTSPSSGCWSPSAAWPQPSRSCGSPGTVAIRARWC
jgi:PAS domain S-box-containing protein